MPAGPVNRIAFDDRFDRLVPSDALIERLAGGAIWAEGPVYLPDDDAVVWSDVRGDRVHRWTATDGDRTLYWPGDFANGHTLDHDGRVLACEHGRRRIARYEADGSRTTVVDRYEGHRPNSAHD